MSKCLKKIFFHDRYEHETETLRQQLQQREQERERTKSMWEQKEMVSFYIY